LHKVSKLQNERDKYKTLYEKTENEISNLNDEISEISLKHSAELKSVKSNLDVRYSFFLFSYSTESNNLTRKMMRLIRRDKKLPSYRKPYKNAKLRSII